MPPPDENYLNLTDEQLLGQCEVDTLRGSGRGGQKRNKTETMVRVRHRPTGLQGLSDDTRSQHQNKREAMRRLRRRLALERRQPVQLEGWAPPEALSRLLAPNKGESIGRNNPLYLPAVAALLDLFVALECSVSQTARRLGLSTGALSRLLLADNHLGRCVNALRTGRGMRSLR